MLAAVRSVSLCTGIRREDAGPSAVAGFADFRALIRGPADGSPAVSAKVEVVGGDAVCRSSKCSRVLAAGADSDSCESEKPAGDAARRCEECTDYMDSVLLPRVREAADAAAAGGGSGSGSGGGSGGSQKRRVVLVRESEAGTKRRIDGSRGDSPADDETTHRQPTPGLVDEGRREVSRRAVTGAKREEASEEGSSRPATEGVSFGQKVGRVSFCMFSRFACMWLR